MKPVLQKIMGITLKFKVLSIIIIVFCLLSCNKKDTTVPLVILEGDANIMVILNTSYTESGATATDDGQPIPVSISGSVDPNFAGVYTITYTAVDNSGNVGTAQRAVNVYNQADTHVGSYFSVCTIAPDTSLFSSDWAVSTIVNQRVWCAGFGLDSTTVVFADIVQDSLIIPRQLAQAGSPSVIHGFFGRGLIVSTFDSIKISILFNDSVLGLTKTGVMTYTKAK